MEATGSGARGRKWTNQLTGTLIKKLYNSGEIPPRHGSITSAKISSNFPSRRPDVRGIQPDCMTTSALPMFDVVINPTEVGAAMERSLRRVVGCFTQLLEEYC